MTIQPPAESRSSDRPPYWHVAIGVVAVVAASALVGWFGSRDGFDWELASVFGTATGTTLLAAATYWLAYSTRSDVRATQDLAQLTRHEQAVRERPVILQEDARFYGTPSDGTAEVALVNVGLGPALRVRVTALYVGQNDWSPSPSIEDQVIPAIAPGEHRTVGLKARFPGPPPPGGLRADGFRFVGDYHDRSRENTYGIITGWEEPSADLPKIGSLE